MGRINEIVFDCGAPSALAEFWAEVLEGYSVRPSAGDTTQLAVLGIDPQRDGTVLVDGPGPTLCFQNVEGRRLDNNRVHLDIVVDDRQAETHRLTDMGAKVVRVLPSYTVLTDPEGNHFCIVDSEDVAMTVAAE